MYRDAQASRTVLTQAFQTMFDRLEADEELIDFNHQRMGFLSGDQAASDALEQLQTCSGFKLPYGLTHRRLRDPEHMCRFTGTAGCHDNAEHLDLSDAHTKPITFAY
ncbi:hypothetical protein GCM10009304_11660 [Pseudomonas matsuisoli]|uniref:Uncharacterized protein n=1 Tax=Pseudomonas matsuisoli TaxID=1515666 RepID=A0A917UV31_9PSED|nr:hypothetical protein GCM10009304_11660 [Pseudomonas matsuisoli]